MLVFLIDHKSNQNTLEFNGCYTRVQNLCPGATQPGWGGIALYCIPALGVAAPSMFVQFYFLNFATDGLLLAPAMVGAILAIGRIWDAISDPLVGYGSDRTRTRWGR